MSTLPVGEASQAGAMTSAGSQAVVNSGVAGEPGNTITATSDTFNDSKGFVGAEGWQVRMANGLNRIIVSVASPTVATLDGAAEVAEPDMPFWLPMPDDSDFYLQSLRPDALLAAAGLTDASRLIGLRLFWGGGDVRVITHISGENIVVDQDGGIPPGPCRMENPAAYAAFTDASHIDRFHWRLIWSMPQQPRRFGAVIPCTIAPTSNTIALKYPVRSIENGQEILIVGVGNGGGNLTATAQWVMLNSVTVGRRRNPGSRRGNQECPCERQGDGSQCARRGFLDPDQPGGCPGDGGPSPRRFGRRPGRFRGSGYPKNRRIGRQRQGE